VTNPLAVASKIWFDHSLLWVATCGFLYYTLTLFGVPFWVRLGVYGWVYFRFFWPVLVDSIDTALSMVRSQALHPSRQ
jgi:hypothetical protein